MLTTMLAAVLAMLLAGLLAWIRTVRVFVLTEQLKFVWQKALDGNIRISKHGTHHCYCHESTIVLFLIIVKRILRSRNLSLFPFYNELAQNHARKKASDLLTKIQQTNQQHGQHTTQFLA